MMAAAAQLNQASASNWDLSDTSTEAETEAQPLTSAEAMEEEKFRWQQWKEPPVYENDCGDDFLDAMKPVGNDFKREESGIRFYPTASSQRYNAVLDMIKKHQKYAKKIVDFGCCDCRFLEHMKTRLNNVKHLIGVDIDLQVLELNRHRIRPLTAEYLWRREHSLKITTFHGSVFDFDSRIGDVDVVTCIEMLEHLHLEDLDTFVESIFGKLRPLLVVITTPNVEFNFLFDMGDRKFRHPDHKFEWSRKEFEDWGDNITRRYNSYWVKYFGIAAGPPGSEPFGMCSQMAVFRRPKEGYPEDKKDREEKATLNPVLKYQLVSEEIYPTADSFLSWAAKVRNEVTYCCYQYSTQKLLAAKEEGSEEELLDEFGYIRVPFDLIIEYSHVKELCQDKSKLLAALLEDSSGTGPNWQFDTTVGSEAIYYPVSSPQHDDRSEEENETWRDEENQTNPNWPEFTSFEESPLPEVEEVWD